MCIIIEKTRIRLRRTSPDIPRPCERQIKVKYLTLFYFYVISVRKMNGIGTTTPLRRNQCGLCLQFRLPISAVYTLHQPADRQTTTYRWQVYLIYSFLGRLHVNRTEGTLIRKIWYPIIRIYWDILNEPLKWDSWIQRSDETISTFINVWFTSLYNTPHFTLKIFRPLTLRVLTISRECS